MERKPKKINQLYFWGLSLAGHLVVLALFGLFIHNDPQGTKPDIPMEVEMVDSSDQTLPPPPKIPEKELNPETLPTMDKKPAFRGLPRLLPSSQGGGNQNATNQPKGNLLGGNGEDSVEGASPNPGENNGSATVNSGPGASVGPSSNSGGTGTETPSKPKIDWRGRFQARVEANKVYPDSAQKSGNQGVVTVRVVIAPNGGLLENTVISSSGHRALDNAAQRAVRDSAPFPHEHGGNLTMNLRIRFQIH